MGVPIKFKGYLFREETESLILENKRLDKVIKFMSKNKIMNLEINSSFCNISDLNFLKDFRFIEGLTILSMSIDDISPLNDLRNLKYLNLQHKLKGKINFQNFANLEECFINWGIRGSESICDVTTLRKLTIDNLNVYDLIEFHKLNKLEYLFICYGKIVNLDGIKNLSSLKTLDLSGCSKLAYIEQLIELEDLESLRLDRCKNVNDFSVLGELENLKFLSFNNIGKIPTIEFLFNLSNLEEILFAENTNVVDGNLNVLYFLHKNRKLKKALFARKRHYSHQPEELGFKIPNVVKRMFRK